MTNHLFKGAVIGAAMAGVLAGAPTFAATGDTLKAVKDRGTLLCTGHNGTYLGFAEVDDKVSLCRIRSCAPDPFFPGCARLTPALPGKNDPVQVTGKGRREARQVAEES